MPAIPPPTAPSALASHPAPPPLRRCELATRPPTPKSIPDECPSAPSAAYNVSQREMPTAPAAHSSDPARPMPHSRSVTTPSNTGRGSIAQRPNLRASSKPSHRMRRRQKTRQPHPHTHHQHTISKLLRTAPATAASRPRPAASLLAMSAPARPARAADHSRPSIPRATTATVRESQKTALLPDRPRSHRPRPKLRPHAPPHNPHRSGRDQRSDRPPQYIQRSHFATPVHAASHHPAWCKQSPPPSATVSARLPHPIPESASLL